MPTKKPRVTFTISEEQLSLVEDFQFSNKIKNQTQAILQLIDKGLEDFSVEALAENLVPPSLEDGDRELLDKFHSLDLIDRGRVLERIDILLGSEKYKQEAV